MSGRQNDTMADSFLKTLTSVITGVRQLEEFCHVVLTSAMEDLLLCVARDYGHDYATLLKKYRDDVVRRHVGISRDATKTVAMCSGTTKSGKPCGKRAVLHGCCQQHAVQAAEEEAKRRKVRAYKATVPTRTMDVVQVLCGSPLVSAEKFVVGSCHVDL